ncbi:MAG: hypothetical protein GY913_19935, partial [Proteobacteria bacterium]|nr:hypothetical protein [Pseudomonadota bacterium]
QDLATWADHPDILLRELKLRGRPGCTRVDLRVEGLALHPIERTRSLDLAWRRGSFSSLMRDEHGWRDGDEPPPESDRASEAQLPEEDADEGDLRIPLADFPSGIKAGNFLHDLLEHHDFGDQAGLGPRVHSALTDHGFDAEKWTEPVTDAIDDALRTPLWPGRTDSLADLDRTDTLREVDIALPACGGYAAQGGVTVDALADVFEQPLGPGAPARTADRIRRLSFTKLRGFLVGQIDLVFRRDGRFYVLDWKSNRLGTTFAAYDEASMASAMLSSGYVLQ